MITDFRMNLVGHVQRPRALWHFNNIAFGSKRVDLVGKNVALNALQKFIGALRFALQLQNFFDHVEFFGVLRLLDAIGLAFFIGPVCGNPVFGNLMHIVSSNLNLQQPAFWTNHRGMQRLIAVCFRHGNIVFKTARHWLPVGMNRAQNGIAILD